MFAAAGVQPRPEPPRRQPETDAELAARLQAEEYRDARRPQPAQAAPLAPDSFEGAGSSGGAAFATPAAADESPWLARARGETPPRPQARSTADLVAGSVTRAQPPPGWGDNPFGESPGSSEGGGESASPLAPPPPPPATTPPVSGWVAFSD